MSSEHTIAAVPKNATEEIRVSLSEFNGYDLAALRVFAEYRGSGEMGPTKKGITFRVELLDEIIAGLEAARATARAQGLPTSREQQRPADRGAA